ncbi:hypothetical protein PX699_17685 [Sphingobium sp. H39-3-25]|uniref:NrdR family transcriptional regulator n=1 Tax=Sphingobium arseniciresistens TaxID=3030834 RepID=UPI0023B96463|nr:hypothetical protein [Sphingobium arseniciresistens]
MSKGLPCPACGNPQSSTVDSRLSPEPLPHIRRGRKCECGHRYTTWEYIEDHTQPECLRTFLEYARSPAHGALITSDKPALFATHKGKRVRVVMASRFGDVGITSVLHAEYGYEKRIARDLLSEFSTKCKRPVSATPATEGRKEPNS